MSFKRLKTKYRKSASILHRAVGDKLKKHSLFSGYRIYQEYPIPNSPYFIDWFIKDLGVAIECHGEQHLRPVAFDGDKEAAKQRFLEQVIRDREKKSLCLAAGWQMTEIWFDETITDDLLSSRINECLEASHGIAQR